MAGSYNTAGLEKNLNFIISDGSTPEHGTDIHYSSAISPVVAKGAGVSSRNWRDDLAALPADFRLVRVGRNKEPAAGTGWFDVEDFSPDDALRLNGSGPPAWGLKTGPASGGVLGLDLDAAGWEESFEKVTGHPISDLPPTISWTSGKPGRSGHAFAVDREWWPQLRNRVPFTRPWREGDSLGKDGKQTDPTLWELRWDRHQSVIVGAHPETSGYRWLEGRSPREIPDPAPAPDWLLEHLLVRELPNVARWVPSAEDSQRAMAMLQCLPAEHFTAYDDWLRVGMALNHTDAGLLSAWVEWCRAMSNFDKAECLAKWQSFGKGHKGRQATIATLHYLAKQHGYREPRHKERTKTGPSDPKTQKKPTLQEVLEKLATAGASGSDLSFKLEKIAGDYDHSLRDVQALYRELVEEKEAALDADDSLDQLEQLSATGNLDVLSLIPPVLANALEGIRHSAEFQHSTLLAVLLAGFSAALPLRSWIELDPAEDFSQPLTLWVLLLMPSGELKTPLLHRLLVKPWQQSVDAVVEQAHRQRVEEWKIAKQAADNGDGPAPGPKPRLPQTLVTEDATVQGLELHMEIHDRWANRSICLWLDEAAAALRQMADPARAGKDASLGGWLLSRYDGTGARGAKVDETRERHYKSCRLAMVAGCQPDLYREITGDADQSGLSARFIVVEQLCVDQRFPICWTEEEARRAEDLRKLLVRCYGVLARTEELHLRLTPEAFALFQGERAAMDQRKRASISAAERSLANKAAGRIGRLAALFHLLWCVAEREEGPISLRKEVGVEAMERAINFNRFLLDQTVGVRLTSAGNNALGALMLKLQRVAWEKRTPLALSELRRALNGRQRPEMGEVLHALQRLEERGYGVLESQEYRGQQGWRYTAKKQLLMAS